ncbi:MAG: electron transfer flavoprotein subunit beta [Acidobacteriia bacterium]|nr:electron transfer flavoprotein subunit beta [Terriglobia bacterium]
MNIAVLTKQVADLVEGIEIDASGRAVDRDSIRYILSESDDHALEEALLLKERSQAHVEVFSLETGEVRDGLCTALAKGADRVVMILAGQETPPSNHAAARMFASVLKGLPFDLILTGVRAIDDLDGSVGGLLAGYLGLPYVGLVRKVELVDGAATVEKEYPGGFAAELGVKLPAVLGIQAAEQPPRYVPVTRLRQVMKTAQVEEQEAEPASEEPVSVERMYKPEEGAGAAMLSGSAEEIARQIVNLLSERRVTR